MGNAPCLGSKPQEDVTVKKGRKRLGSAGVTWVLPYGFAIQISPGTDANIWALMCMVTFISLFLMPWGIEDYVCYFH